MPTHKWSDIQIIARPEDWKVEVGAGKDKWAEVKARLKRKVKGSQKVAMVEMAMESLIWIHEQLVEEGFDPKTYDIRVMMPSFETTRILRGESKDLACAKILQPWLKTTLRFRNVYVLTSTPKAA